MLLRALSGPFRTSSCLRWVSTSAIRAAAGEGGGGGGAAAASMSGSQSASPKKSSYSFFSSLLNKDNLQVVAEERSLLRTLHESLKRIGGLEEDIELVADTHARLDSFFSIVVVGEFNAGKSSFINSLLGDDYLKAGILPTTDKVCVLKHGTDGVEFNESNLLMKDVQILDLPVEWLQNVAIIDTPGTNAIIKHHEQITSLAVPRSDLVIFVTSAEKPISESEATFLNRIKRWGKKVVVVVNKIDLLRNQEEKNQILSYVTHNVTTILGSVNPIPVFGVSSRLGLDSKKLSESGDPALGLGANTWRASLLGEFEEYLKTILGEKELIQGKLQNALNVSDRVTHNAIASLKDRKALLDGDTRVLEFIDDSMALFANDITRDTAYYRVKIDKVISEIQERAQGFFDASVKMTNPKLLFNPDAFQEEFKRNVIIEIAKPVDTVIQEMAALVAQRSRVQAREVIEYIRARPKAQQKISSGVIAIETRQEVFDMVRGEIIEKMAGSVKEVLVAHNHVKDVEDISKSLKSASQLAAGIQVASAATIGGLVVMQMMDVTAVVFSSSLAIAGIVLVPWKKRQLTHEFNGRLDVMKKQLKSSIGTHLEHELMGVKSSILESVVPYRRFISIEQKKHDENFEAFKNLSTRIGSVRNKLES